MCVFAMDGDKGRDGGKKNPMGAVTGRARGEVGSAGAGTRHSYDISVNL